MTDDERISGDAANPMARNAASPLHAMGAIQHIAGLRESRAAIDTVIAAARRTLRLFDRDLADPGYRTPARIQMLESFLLASRRNRIRIVLHETAHLHRDCARLMALYRRHTTAFDIHRTINAARPAADALLIADEHSFCHRLHQDQPRAVLALGNEAGASPLVLRFEEIWDSSEVPVGLTVLGL